MEKLACTGDAACRQYCEALRAQGLEVGEVESACQVPDMFSVIEDGIEFNPQPSVDKLQNPALAEQLAGSLLVTLTNRQKLAESPQTKEARELLECHEDAFSARLGLWQAMIQATEDGRRFTDVELGFFEKEIDQANTKLAERQVESSAEVNITARAAFDHRTLKHYGLLFDDEAVSDVNRLVGNLIEGKPSLLVGDKGIAKTHLAKFVAKLKDPDSEPVVISGHGDMMSNELIGQTDLESGSTIFKQGKLVNAMQEGRPVILDEVNIGDQSIVMRLQDILLLRPGDKIILQENGGTSIEVKSGFAVYTTANEASSRYQHRNVLDPAFRDRFDIIARQYPDMDNGKPIDNDPKSLMRLAIAASVDGEGIRSRHIDASELAKFVRLAHVTQHLYSIPASDARVGSLTDGGTSDFLDDEPAMTDCITPRTVADTILRCAPGNKPDMTLATEIDKTIAALDQAGGTKNSRLAKKALTVLEGKIKS